MDFAHRIWHVFNSRVTPVRCQENLRRSGGSTDRNGESVAS